MQGGKGIEPFRIIFEPPGVPLVVQKAGFGILPIPGEQGAPVNARFIHVVDHPHPVGPSLEPGPLLRQNQFEPMFFAFCLGKSSRIPENLGRVAMSVGINDHDAILAYDFHPIFRPGDFRSRGDQAESAGWLLVDSSFRLREASMKEAKRG